MIKFNGKGLPDEGPEREEAEQLYEDFMQRAAEEQLELAEEKQRAAEELELEKEKNIKKETPMDQYVKKLTASFEAMSRVMDSENFKNIKNRMSADGDSNIWVELETKDIKDVESENINTKEEEEQ
jgi:hypothetical protein